MATKETTLRITVTRDADFMEWYTQVVQKAELADYSAVSGCMVLRPRAYAIWQKTQEAMNQKMKALGIRNAYFPLLIPERLLNKEAEHLEGFSPEVAWVTTSGSEEFPERLAVRPTSETIMYDSYAKWIRSHRDLPLRLNQWCNVVRWEFKHPTLLLRTREFLWQEGHTAFATQQEAQQEVMDIIAMYNEILRDYYALPGLIGRKTNKEKFAGADYTITIELLMPNGKAIQGPDSHQLGQHFSKAFNITFLDEQGKSQFAWQNSWGFTTRMIGILVGIHSDDKGLIIPPRLAENQVAIIPILFDKDKERVLKKAKEVARMLKEHDPFLDDREGYSPGWKYNDAELKGIPLRIEIGPKDVDKDQVVLVRRDTGEKQPCKMKDLPKNVDELLHAIHDHLYQKAYDFLHSHVEQATTTKEVEQLIKQQKIALIPLCDQESCEDALREKFSGAKTLNIPLDQPKQKGACLACGKPADYWVYFARSY